jgi:RimJ/RimL family protein N-acetyltransferase
MEDTLSGDGLMAIIATGIHVILRDLLQSDADRFFYWQTHGEWRLLDAPWEGVHTSLTEEQEATLRTQFYKSCTEELPSPRKRVFITGKDDCPIGWASRYGEDRTPGAWMVGIDTCEDDLLNKGLGTEALGLWVDYLFANSTVHRIDLETWSFNPQMSHVAGKLGFVLEGSQREARQWNGQWLDLVHFGVLRTEWKLKRVNRRGSRI